MSKLITFQSDFTAGEVSPKLLARTDLKAYDNALKTMINAYPMTHGGAKRRPGTIYIGEVAASTETVRLIPFIYSKTTSFVLVFNNGKIQFIRDGAFIMSGPSRYEIPSPFSESELPDVTFAQSGNALYLAHTNYAPRLLQRVSDTNWTITLLNFTYRAISDQWYKNDYIKFKIITGLNPFAVGDVFTVTTNASGDVTGTTGPVPLGTNKGVIYGATKVNNAVAQTWTITCIISTGSRQEWTVSGSVSGTPTLTWNTDKYPATVGFFEQRLYYGGTSAEPQTVWGSVIGDYSNFTIGPNNDDAVQFTFSSNRYDQVAHLESARQLLAMTVGGEYSLVGGTAGITPTSVRIRANTFHGSSHIKPIRISQEVVFVQRDRKKVRAVSYSVAEDTNLASDLTLFAEHVTGTGLVDMSFTQDPDYLLWAIRDDGILASMTHLRDQAITGWARHITDGEFENCAAVPEATADQTYLVVRRDINGVSKRYIELLDYTTGAMTDCSAFGYSASETASWSGLTHLEGKTVAVVADGIPHPNCTVSGGAITLNYPVNNIEVGLPYTTTLEILHPARDLPDGSSHARALTIPQVTIRFQNATTCTVNGYNVPFRTNQVALGTPTPPFTGDKQVTLLGWQVPVTLTIEQTQPAPLTVLGIAIKMIVPDLTE